MVKVLGKTVDEQTRCEHYHSAKDIIAMKFKCCNRYYPCYKCHEECSNHPIEVWKREEFYEKAILCGVCKTEHSIHDYMKQSYCNTCNSSFNERCSTHYPIYFEV